MLAKPVNEYVFSNLLQLIPNYPPYAMEIVNNRRGGKAVFGGNIAQALSASPFVDEVLACDIDSELTEFYKRLVEIMKETPQREDFLRQFNETLERYRTNGRTLATGHITHVPFLVHDEFYRNVREELGKVKIHTGDEQEFLDWLRGRNYKADLIDDNNLPEYVKNWISLFSRPPLKEGGIRLFGKRDRDVYTMPDGSLHPGTIERGIGGYVCAPPKTGEKKDVLEVLKNLGYAPIDAPIVYRASWDPSNVRYEERGSNGLAKIWVVELNQRLSGGTHNLFTLQYKPK